MVGAFALAAREKDYVKLILSPELARLRPYTATNHQKLVYLASTRGAFTQADCEALWELGAPRLLRLARDVDTLAIDQLLTAGNLLCMLFPGPVLYPAVFAEEWQGLWNSAYRQGLARARFFRLQLAIIGTFTGHCGPHVDWLMDASNRRYEMADVFGFVRHDLGRDVLLCDADHVRGNLPRSVQPATCTLSQMSRYVRACMRDARHFQNEGQALMVLTWAEMLGEHLSAAGSISMLDEDMMRLAAGLESLERVQRIEKSRFFRMWDGLTNGPVKDRLKHLWARSYAQPIPDGGAR